MGGVSRRTGQCVPLLCSARCPWAPNELSSRRRPSELKDRSRMLLSPSAVRSHLSALFRRYGVSCQEGLLARLRASGAVPESAGRSGEGGQSSP